MIGPDAGAAEVSAFVEAAARGEFGTVQANILYGEVSKSDISTALDKAAKNLDFAVTKLLFNHNSAPINKDIYPYLIPIIARGDKALSAEEEPIDLAWDKIITPILNTDKPAKKSHVEAILLGIEQVVLSTTALKKDEKAKKFARHGLKKITALTPGKKSRKAIDRINNLFITRTGSSSQVEKVAKTIGKKESEELVRKLVLDTDWAAGAEDKKDIQKQIRVLIKRKGGKKLESEAKKAMAKISKVNHFITEAAEHIAAPHKEIRVSRVKSMRKVKEIQAVVKKWKKFATTSLALAGAAASGVSDEKYDKLDDSQLVVGFIAKNLKRTKKRALKNAEVQYFVAKDPKDRLQAIAVTTPCHKDRAICLDYLATNPDNLQIVKAGKHPLSGAGTALIQRVAKEAIKAGRSRVLLTTTATAENWYMTNFGFRKINPPYDLQDMEVGEGQTLLQLDGDALRRAAS